MNITLTQKDADFILNYLRVDLQKLNDACDSVNGNLNKIREMRDKDEELRNNLFANIFASKINEQADEFSSLYKRKTDILVKCIELLTVGSAND